MGSVASSVACIPSPPSPVVQPPLPLTTACGFPARVSRITSVSWSSLPSDPPPPSALQTPLKGSPCESSRLSAPGRVLPPSEPRVSGAGLPTVMLDGVVHCVRALAGGTPLPILVVFLRACGIDRSHPFSGCLSGSALWPIFAGAQISLSVKC